MYYIYINVYHKDLVLKQLSKGGSLRIKNCGLQTHTDSIYQCTSMLTSLEQSGSAPNETPQKQLVWSRGDAFFMPATNAFFVSSAHRRSSSS